MLPVKGVLGYCPGDARTSGRKCCVCHHVALQWLHEGDTRVFASSAAIGPPLIIGFRLQCDAEPVGAYGIASFIETYSRNADTRVIPRATNRGKR